MAGTACFCLTGTAAPQQGAPVLDVRATATAPKIDGVLDDPAWQDAAHSDAFRQIIPLENADPTERTEFWVTYDKDNIYIAVRCDDSAGPAGIRAYSMQHDDDNRADDLVRLVFDTFHRENDGYYFALLAGGGKIEGLVQDKDVANPEWDAIWQGKTRIDAGGWSAEFAIPVKSLAFDPSIDTWGFNIARRVSRKQEAVRWSGFQRSKFTTSLPDLGEIHGLSGLQQGRGIDFKPFATLTRTSDPAPEEELFKFKPGFDLIWQVTPSLAATLSVNTDFADAEVDQRQINLGRFPLFFPEKRAFFLQDASLFTFGGIVEGVATPYFSRRIGLADDGSQIDILAGGKVSGRLGRVTLGLFDVQTEAHNGVDPKNLFVARTAVEVLSESNVGLLVTNGDPRANVSNHTVGADFNFRNSHLPGGKTLAAHTYAIVTDSELAGGRDTDFGVSVSYPNEPFFMLSDNRRIGSRFDPGLGFVPRAGIYESFNQAGYIWLPEAHGVRSIYLSAQAYWTLDLKGQVVSEDHDLPVLEIESTLGDQLFIEYTRTRERLDEPFEIQPGISIPVDDYTWGRIQVGINTARSRSVSVNVRVRDQGFYTGHRRDYGAAVEWRASRFFFTSLSATLQQVRLPEGDFDVRVGQFQAIYNFSTDLQFNLLAQYDNLSASVGVNFRVKYIIKPGDELFFIVDQGYDTSLDSFRPTTNQTSLKGAWTIRF
jgi:Domain of unknown function (DUF5916)